MSKSTPETEREAVKRLDSLTVDQTITLPAIEIFHCRRAAGESIAVAYETALRAILGEKRG